MNIVVTQTSGGALHFDTPKKGQNKDLYSALILAAYGIKALEHEGEEDTEPLLHGSSGLIRTRDGSSWQTRSGSNESHVTSSAALLVGRDN